jgi:SAM-dependent methyltransferase
MLTATEDAVFRFRAIRSSGCPLEDDPEPMVQQQLARLVFFEQVVGAADAVVLDWGCGSGFNCQWLRQVAGARAILGFDVCAGAIELARRSFPDIAFEVADACDPALSLQPGRWDRILSCEVLEHVPDMAGFLANLRRHLAPGGIAFVSTPNREVFSLGFEPSPVNREHVKELDLAEFTALLHRSFPSVEVFGQRFARPELLRAWEADVRHKIDLCRQGRRWTDQPSLRGRLRRFRPIDWAYRVPLLRSAWRAVRWGLAEKVRTGLRRPQAPYRWDDFEFTRADLTDAVWFCAVLRT